MTEAAFWIGYHARLNPGHTALVDLATDRRFTYGELDSRVRRLANHLVASGIGAGDRINVLARNSTNIFEVFYACGLIGAVFVPLNWRLSPSELAGIVDDCLPAAIIYDDAMQSVALNLANELGVEMTLGWNSSATGHSPDSYESAINFSNEEVSVADLSEDSPWVIIYTSGTTGVPKGVVHTIRSVRANITNSVLATGMSSSSVTLSVLPTFHVAGLHVCANDALYQGATLLIMQSFDAEQCLQLLSDPQQGITHFGGGPPAVLQMISSLPEFNDTELQPFVGAVGGSPVPPTLLRTWADRGIPLISIYGVSEAGSTVLTTSTDPARSPAGAAGVPTAHARCEVRDINGRQVPSGTAGELWISGPMLMDRYWNRPEATAEALTADGWLRTGDVARQDEEGLFYIVDRSKDMYISGGENVYPAEVENVLYQHPAVVMAAVIGVADERWGESGHAFIVLKGSERPSADDLRIWCRERLASFKVPKSFDFPDDLPRNSTGKIQKRDLRIHV